MSSLSLPERLGQWAAGSNTTEAAVELLIETGYWLDRAEFIASALVDHETVTRIDWEQAFNLSGSLQCSAGERFLLRLACSLADERYEVAMAGVASIDGRNLQHAKQALHTAKFGW